MIALWIIEIFIFTRKIPRWQKFATTPKNKKKTQKTEFYAFSKSLPISCLNLWFKHHGITLDPSKSFTDKNNKKKTLILF